MGSKREAALEEKYIREHEKEVLQHLKEDLSKKKKR